MSTGIKKSDVPQEVLRAQLNEMVTAFNEFHEKITSLKKEQREVIVHIRSMIDQKKIEQIQSLLKQAQ